MGLNPRTLLAGEVTPLCIPQLRGPDAKISQSYIPEIYDMADGVIYARLVETAHI
jgi:hypothetical protein